MKKLLLKAEQFEKFAVNLGITRPHYERLVEEDFGEPRKILEVKPSSEPKYNQIVEHAFNNFISKLNNLCNGRVSIDLIYKISPWKKAFNNFLSKDQKMMFDQADAFIGSLAELEREYKEDQEDLNEILKVDDAFSRLVHILSFRIPKLKYLI